MRNTVVSLFAFTSLVCGVTAKVTATGKIVDPDGKPVEHASVMVYSAGSKKGYSIFCPTCYVDCGKRAFTDADGSYQIPGLSADLHFNLLVVREGFNSQFVNKVDPERGPAETAKLKTRKALTDPAQIVRGKVVNREGAPVRDALVEQHGAVFPNGGQMYGSTGWIDQIAVTNEKGEFELANRKPLAQAIVQVSPRGMASLLTRVASGGEPKTVTVTDGASIRGRLMKDGKPVPNVELGLSSHSRNSDYIPEVRIGTDEEGRFMITNVPAGRVYYLYGRMDSLAPLGLAADLVETATKDEGQEVNVGDIAVRPGFTLRGKVVLSDGRPVPSKMSLTLSQDRYSDSQIVPLAADGSFEVKGLARGVYTAFPAVQDYQLGDGKRCVEFLLEGDTSNFTIVVKPGIPY